MSVFENMKVMVRDTDFGQGFELYARKDGGQGYLQIKEVEWIEHKKGYMATPFLGIDPQTAQSLIDQLWSCGLRPTEGTGSAGSLRATEKHLDDMRTIAFKGLDIGD